MAGVERDGEQRALLPLERLFFCSGRTRLRACARTPDLRRAAPFDDEHVLLVHVLFDVQGAARRHLDDVEPPQAFRAVELDIAAPSADPLPGGERQILHAPDADAAETGDALRLHEAVVGHRRPLEQAVAGVAAGRRLVPMHPVRIIVRHGVDPSSVSLPT